MALSYADIEGIWISAGGSQASAPLAAAIAMAESGGNPNSLNNNPSTGDLSYGLWQINMIGSIGPARRKQFGITNNSALLDPATNAKAAVAVSNGGTNFTPWTTFTSGAFKKFLDGTVPPNLSSGGNSGQPAQDVSVVSGIVTPIVDDVENALNYMFMGALFVGGLLLMVGALWALIRETETLNSGQSVAGSIADVALISRILR